MYVCMSSDDDLSSRPIYDTQAFHRTHYRPDNAHLYIVGDVDVGQAEEMIRKYFGHLESGGGPSKEAQTLKLQSRHFPPVTHYFSGGRFDRFAKESLPESLRTLGQGTTRTLKPRIFQHENIQVGR